MSLWYGEIKFLHQLGMPLELPIYQPEVNLWIDAYQASMRVSIVKQS